MISASGGRTAARYIHDPAIPTLTHPAQHSLRTLHRDPQVDIEDGRQWARSASPSGSGMFNPTELTMPSIA
jgi:hypothetical protein